MAKQELQERLLKAIEETEHAIDEGWQLPDGQPAQSRLAKLAEHLRGAESHVRSGQGMDALEFRGVVRWLTDWIPNLDHPLVAAVAQVEKAAQEEIGISSGRPNQTLH